MKRQKQRLKKICTVPRWSWTTVEPLIILSLMSTVCTNSSSFYTVISFNLNWTIDLIFHNLWIGEACFQIYYFLNYKTGFHYNICVYWNTGFSFNGALKEHRDRKQFTAMWQQASIKVRATCSDDRQNSCWWCKVSGMELNCSQLWGNVIEVTTNGSEKILLTSRWSQHWVPQNVYHKEATATTLVPTSNDAQELQ